MKAGLDRSIARGTYTLIAARYTRRLEGAAGGRRRSTDEGVARSGCARPTESPASLDSPSKSKGDEITGQLAILLRICQVSPGDTTTVRGARTRSRRGKGEGTERSRVSPIFASLLPPRPHSPAGLFFDPIIRRFLQKSARQSLRQL